MSLSTKDYFYELPQELIAQTPATPRDSSRLLVLNKDDSIEHKRFYDIIDYLKEGDVLVRNNTRVIPARIYGRKEETGTDIELLLLKRHSLDTWETLMRPAKRIKLGGRVVFGDGELIAEVTEITEDGNRMVRFNFDGVFEDILERIGNMPLPPYITKKLEDKERYQTVYSRVEGSSAAPTAGLHFTPELLKRIEDKGVKIVDVLLHVGLGTFRPVSCDNILEHKMHSEYYKVGRETAEEINLAKEQGRRIISVGTTSTRVLESMFRQYGKACECEGDTEIFIYPGYQFKAIDGIITNFHLPESTLIMMISAFKSRELILDVYRQAVEKRYRFFSFGDAMIILK